MIYCQLKYSFELTAQNWLKIKKLKLWPDFSPLLEWFCQGLNKPAGKGNSCRFSYCSASNSGVCWSCPMPRYKQEAFHGLYSHLFSLRFVNPVFLNICVRSAGAAEHFSISAAHSPPKPCKASQAWAILKIHLRSGRTQRVTFSFWHQQMPGPATPPDEIAFLSGVSLCTSTGRDPRRFWQCK